MSNDKKKERCIWLNGRIVPVGEATVCVLSPTAQFGLNVFEGIPCYWNRVEERLYAFRLSDHHDRLLQSARLMQINCPYSKDDLREAFICAVNSGDYRENISVRQTVFIEGEGSWGSADPVGMFVAPIERKKTSAEYNKTGLKACISSWRRIGDNTISPRIKCGANYINSRMGQREAIRNGYDTCIFLNDKDKIAEAPGSCVFIIKNGRLVTPLLTDSVLESITRRTIIDIAKELDIETEERTIDRTELYTADEMFLCGSAMEIRPVLSIDGYVLMDKAGEWTKAIHDRYLYYAMGNDRELHNWAEPI